MLSTLVTLTFDLAILKRVTFWGHLCHGVPSCQISACFCSQLWIRHGRHRPSDRKTTANNALCPTLWGNGI